VIHDAHRPLRDGGVGVSEYLPAIDEMAVHASIVVEFEHLAGSTITTSINAPLRCGVNSTKISICAA
jgi:hypothetical protein